MKYEKSRKNVNIKPLKSRNEEDVERILENSRRRKIELAKNLKERYEDLATGRCRYRGGRRTLTK